MAVLLDAFRIYDATPALRTIISMTHQPNGATTLGGQTHVAFRLKKGPTLQGQDLQSAGRTTVLHNAFEMRKSPHLIVQQTVTNTGKDRRTVWHSPCNVCQPWREENRKSRQEQIATYTSQARNPDHVGSDTQAR